jgi:hypothetical protein
MSGSYSSISTNTKLSEFGNFTIHSDENGENNKKQKFAKKNENVAVINSKMQQQETVLKLVKPAPLVNLDIYGFCGFNDKFLGTQSMRKCRQQPKCIIAPNSGKETGRTIRDIHRRRQ